jgi:hypothetical protein
VASSKLRFCSVVAVNVRLHGTSPWHHFLVRGISIFGRTSPVRNVACKNYE